MREEVFVLFGVGIFITQLHVVLDWSEVVAQKIVHVCTHGMYLN